MIESIAFFHPLSLYSLWEVYVVFMAFYFIHACVSLCSSTNLSSFHLHFDLRLLSLVFKNLDFILFILSVCSLENGNLSVHLQMTLRRPWRLACRHKQFLCGILWNRHDSPSHSFRRNATHTRLYMQIYVYFCRVFLCASSGTVEQSAGVAQGKSLWHDDFD